MVAERKPSLRFLQEGTVVGTAERDLDVNLSTGLKTYRLGKTMIVSLDQSVIPNQRGYASVNAQTAAYTAKPTDANSLITISSASALALTIPNDSLTNFPIGTVIALCQLGTGQASFAAASGVTISTALLLTLRAQYSVASVVKISANSWIAYGDLT